MKILIVEDDPDLRDVLKAHLLQDAHTVDVAENGNEGSFLARTYTYDLIILDHALPQKNGLTVCKDIRGSGKITPILFLSMLGDVEIKVEALLHGADDYMIKPFSWSELRARIQAITRRANQSNGEHLHIDDLTLDSSVFQANRGDISIRLTKKEFALLEYMMRNKGVILSRAMLMEHVWSADSDPFSNTVEAHIRNLRKKLNIGDKPDLIANIPGHGYIIDCADKLHRFNR